MKLLPAENAKTTYCPVSLLSARWTPLPGRCKCHFLEETWSNSWKHKNIRTKTVTIKNFLVTLHNHSRHFEVPELATLIHLLCYHTLRLGFCDEWRCTADDDVCRAVLGARCTAKIWNCGQRFKLAGREILSAPLPTYRSDRVPVVLAWLIMNTFELFRMKAVLGQRIYEDLSTWCIIKLPDYVGRWD